jgi:hypothetical protein
MDERNPNITRTFPRNPTCFTLVGEAVILVWNFITLPSLFVSPKPGLVMAHCVDSTSAASIKDLIEFFLL